MSTAVQLALFGEEPPRPREHSQNLARYPRQPGYEAPGASQEAAQRVAADAFGLRAVVLDELRLWPSGRTADEIATSLRRSPLSVRPRLSELRAAGKIVATEERRRNESGLTATVWKAA
jgi:hypothetical protein